MVSRKRHIAKTLTWRVLATTDTFIITFFASTLGFGYETSEAVVLGGTVASLEVITKLVLYYLHERAWYNYSDFGVGKNENKE